MQNVSRRSFLQAAGASALGVASACGPAPRAGVNPASGGRLLYVGTYTRGKSEGIYVSRMDPETGAVTVESSVGGVSNPSFLAVDRGSRHLYAVNETGEFRGEKSGSVKAFAIDPATGGLRPIGEESSRGAGPCHLTVDPSNRFVLVANYGGGTAAVLPVLPDGGLGPATSVVRHEGSGPNRARQEGPHAHSVTLDPAGRFAFVADLGIDRLMGYRFDPATGALSPGEGVTVEPGAGPRHFEFHPRGDRAYLINELTSTLTALAYDAASGRLTPTATVPTLPADFGGRSHAADVHVHPSGSFVYGSNRGHDSIVVYGIAAGSGELTLVQHQPTLGRTPRNFAIDPTGRFLLVANQDSHGIVTFAIDSETGRLRHTGAIASVPMPVCLRFA